LLRQEEERRRRGYCRLNSELKISSPESLFNNVESGMHVIISRSFVKERNGTDEIY